MKWCFIAPGYKTVDILHDNSNEFGGGESQVAYLATGLAKLGHQVDLIYGDDRANVAPRVIAGIRCLHAFPSWKRPESLPAFWAALNESAADLIYARVPNVFLWLTGIFSKSHPSSTLVFAPGGDRNCNPWQAFTPRNKWLHTPLYALGLQLVDIIAAQHDAQADLIRPYVRGKLIVVPNLMPTITWKARKFEETDIDAIWIAGIRPVKQLPVFLDVAEKLPDLQFAVVGGFAASVDQESRRDLENRMARMSNLRFLGPQPREKVFQLLIRSKILVNTSVWEGFPNTMLEAWSVNVPVVSLKIDPGGVIQQETIGLVSGTIPQLIHDVEQLVQTRQLNCEMGKKGREYVDKTHNWEAVRRALEQVMPGVQPQDDRLAAEESHAVT
ncbi:MAG: glycosyltransferase family 4 protein [Anaerolineae bacterium]|nr:glycosyltransferase family 4 protein [Anaerolineae bacterium]